MRLTLSLAYALFRDWLAIDVIGWLRDVPVSSTNPAQPLCVGRRSGKIKRCPLCQKE